MFNRLTGADVISSNYPGTTVEYTKGTITIDGERVEVVDVPGTYSLEPTCKAEEIAVSMVDEGDVIIDVAAATNLERSLNLTLQIIKCRKPMIVALNLWDEIKHTGVSIDVEKLENILGVPCVPTCAVTGEGINHLVKRIKEAKVSSFTWAEEDRWNVIGRIVSEVQSVTHRHHTLLEKLGDASVVPVTGIPIAAVVLYLTFTVIRFIGEGLIKTISEPLFGRFWTPLMLNLSGFLGGKGFFHDIIIGKLIDGAIDYEQSFGLLTTGLFVPLGTVLPYVTGFYIVLAFLEDSGYLPRLAVMTDTLMHRLGIHGLAVIPMLLGLGCNVPGVMATRILETRRERFIAATLISIAVPCMALQSMVFGLLGKYGAKGIGTVFVALFIVWILLGLLLNRLVAGKSPEIFVEIPPYRIPYMKGLFVKILIRLKWFLREAVPFVIAGVFIANLLYTLGIIRFIEIITAPLISGLLGLPSEAVGALIIGFLRKDVAVGMLIPLGMSLKQLIIASVVLSMYFPCIATFTTLLRELGSADMLKSAAIMVAASLTVGGFLNLIL